MPVTLDPLPPAASPAAAHHRIGWRALGAVVALTALVAASGCARSVDGLITALRASKTSADGTMVWLSGEHEGLRLSAADARDLARNPLGVALRHLHELDVTAAEALAACAGSLQFDALTTIDPAAARALAAHRGTLRLNAVAHLSPGAAAGLAGHPGRLSLDGLRTLDYPAALALARHRGPLVLNGLVTLDAAAAHALARHEGPVCVNGLELIDGETAAILAGRPDAPTPYVSRAPAPAPVVHVATR